MYVCLALSGVHKYDTLPHPMNECVLRVFIYLFDYIIQLFLGVIVTQLNSVSVN